MKANTPTSEALDRLAKALDDELEEFGYAIANHREASRESLKRPYKKALLALFTTELSSIRSEIEAKRDVAYQYCHTHEALVCRCNSKSMVSMEAIQSIFERHGVK